MRARPAVSVIIPTHDRCNLLCAALDSVLQQSFRGFEAIVIDDGSTDGTPEYVRGLSDPRVRYHWQEASGLPAAARNAGLRMARGTYVAFLDADDVWYPDKLERQLICFERHPEVGLVYTNAHYFGKTLRQGRPMFRRFLSGHAFDQLLLGNRIPALTVMVRHECLRQVGVFSEDHELRGVKDYELWLRIAQRYPIHPVRRVLAAYRRHGANLWNSDLARAMATIKVVGRFEESTTAGSWRKARSVQCARLAWHYYRTGDRSGFGATYREAMQARFNLSLFAFRQCDRLLGSGATLRLMRLVGLE
jgi:glycosyltransferase involved in cell wall biosynthesis